MEGALVHRAITEENYRAASCVLVLLGEGYPCSQRQLRPYDGVTAHETLSRVKDVHRTAFTFAQAGALTEHLCHHAICV